MSDNNKRILEAEDQRLKLSAEAIQSMKAGLGGQKKSSLLTGVNINAALGIQRRRYVVNFPSSFLVVWKFNVQ